MKELKISNGTTLVDDDVFKYASKYRWCVNGSGYVQHSGKYIRGLGTQETILLHREVNKTPSHMQTDHINGDLLDNRRCNLRSVTASQNQYNTKPRKGCSSKYKGVSFFKGIKNLKKPWHAYIRINKRRTFLGYHHTEIEAAKAYNEAALTHFGKYAWLNKV